MKEVNVMDEISKDPKQYIKRMRSRDEQLSLKWGTICTPVKMVAAEMSKLIEDVVREPMDKL